jgi:hypothetical protein
MFVISNRWRITVHISSSHEINSNIVKWHLYDSKLTTFPFRFTTEQVYDYSSTELSTNQTRLPFRNVVSQFNVSQLVQRKQVLPLPTFHPIHYSKNH